MKKILQKISFAFLLLALLIVPVISHAAIARDSSSHGFSAGTGFAQTISGSNRLLLVYVYTSGSNTITSVTYNGVSLTRLVNYSAQQLYIYGILSPATGTHNIVVNVSSGNAYGFASSYTGVKQTALPNVSTHNLVTGVNNITTTIPNNANKSWAFLGVSTGGNAVTAGTNSTAVEAQQIAGFQMFDNQGAGAISQGSFGMNVSTSNTIGLITVMVSFAPVEAGSGDMMRMGMGF